MTQLSQPNTAALIPMVYPLTPAAPARDLAEVSRVARERVREYIDNTTAHATKAAYASDWSHFESWCAALGVVAMPASVDTVIAYLSELPTMEHSARHGRGARKAAKVGYSVASMERRLATISARHKAAGHANPCGHDNAPIVIPGARPR